MIKRNDSPCDVLRNTSDIHHTSSLTDANLSYHLTLRKLRICLPLPTLFSPRPNLSHFVLPNFRNDLKKSINFAPRSVALASNSSNNSKHNTPNESTTSTSNQAPLYSSATSALRKNSTAKPSLAISAP